ncbi:MAG TPA: alpha/beta fold hydrolase [Vicinamibacterales bacterium]|nr:alpha/beta fold hydrolase [Vicinamibacterales bacterium]
MKLCWKHSTVGALMVLWAIGSAAAQAPAGHTFHVFLRGAEAGTEEVTVLGTAEGWALRGSGRLGAPLNLTTEYWEIRYDRAWRPIELTVGQADQTNKWSVHTTVSGTTAASDVTQNGQNERRNLTIAPDAVVLPNLIFGSYEALAVRLATASPGAQIAAFIVPQNSVSITVVRVAEETIQVPGRLIAAKHWSLLFGAPGNALNMDVWIEGERLLRVDIPSQMLTVIRDDISSVSARMITMARPNDEQVTIPANGFGLAATLSKPTQMGTRLPAIVLVSSASTTDRDEIVAGIPVFAQLATSLADAGFVVVRYDKRGTGQSGGRPESATYDDFSADLRAVIGHLLKRKDVDPKRVALIGYGEGGWIALATAAKENKVAAVVTIGTPSAKGVDLVLEQQRQLFEGSGTSAAAQEKAVEQQKSILQAVISGKGWDALAPDIRRQVDTPMYRSFLLFDPAQVLSKTRQPLLVVQADLDREVPTFHGEQLAQLGRSRLKAQPTDFVHLPGLNHLLARAETGSVGEYGSLTERSISPAAVLEISAWLKKTLAPPQERAK